jgi:6-phosphogluconolactonase
LNSTHIGLAALLAVGTIASSTSAQAPRVPFVFVSGYRPEIATFRLDTAAAKLVRVGTTNAGTDPSFLAWDPDAKFLFAVNETDPGRVRSFRIDQVTGALTPINDVPAMGSITAHLSTDRTGRWLLVANYGDLKDGTIALFPIRVPMGVSVRRQTPETSAPARWLITSRPNPANRFVFVPLKGGRRWPSSIRRVDRPGEPNVPPLVTAAPAQDLVTSTSIRTVVTYVINELDLTMTALCMRCRDRVAPRAASAADLPEAAEKVGASAADVPCIVPAGSCALQPRHDSIVIFRLDEAGRMTLVGHEIATFRRGISRSIDGHADAGGQSGRRQCYDVPHRSEQRQARSGRPAGPGRTEPFVCRRRHVTWHVAQGFSPAPWGSRCVFSLPP